MPFTEELEQQICPMCNNAHPCQYKQVACVRCGHVWMPRAKEYRKCPQCKTEWPDKPKAIKADYKV